MLCCITGMTKTLQTFVSKSDGLPGCVSTVSNKEYPHYNGHKFWNLWVAKSLHFVPRGKVTDSNVLPVLPNARVSKVHLHMSSFFLSAQQQPASVSEVVHCPRCLQLSSLWVQHVQGILISHFFVGCTSQHLCLHTRQRSALTGP